MNGREAQESGLRLKGRKRKRPEMLRGRRALYLAAPIDRNPRLTAHTDRQALNGN